jgi:phage/plasmid-associated DNA primase
MNKEGTGKSMFYSLLKSMIGNRFYSVGDVKKNLLGNFNSALLNSYVINLEEIDYFSSKDSADILKNLITETDLEVNAKGKDAKMIKSVHRFIGNTNHTIIPLKISANDRRYCIIRSSDEKKGNSDYFTKLNQIITSKDLQATFYKYLSTIDINNFISCKIPQTEYLDELKETFETPLSDFIKELLIDNDKEIIYESSNELFRMFDIFLTKNKYKVGSDWSIRKFGLEMNEFIKEGDYITRIKKSGKNYYSIDCIKAIERFNIHNEPDNNEYCIDSD